MGLLKKLLPLLILAAIPACAQVYETPVSVTPSPLNGNWHLTGDRQQKQYPQISMSIEVHGTEILASGSIALSCNGASAGGIGGSLSISGTIAPDGTFKLITTHPRNTIQTTITGKAPVPSATNWSGEYHLAVDSLNCHIDQTGPFTATPLAPFNGAFRGTAFVYPGSSGTVTLELTVAQEPLYAFTIRTGAFAFRMPLTGAIRVKGFPCFSQGKITTQKYTSLIQGDHSYLWFDMDDGSRLALQPVFTDSTESAVDLSMAYVIGGKCDGQGFIRATLDRQ